MTILNKALIYKKVIYKALIYKKVINKPLIYKDYELWFLQEKIIKKKHSVLFIMCPR